ncbi:MAG: vitamin K epoxide reductase family protein [Pseudoclavibacter sp.]|jgi:uncharacterized membrane protein
MRAIHVPDPPSPASTPVTEPEDPPRIGARPGVALVWLITGLVGFGTAFLLINEVVQSALGHKSLVSCDINSVLSCSPNFFAPAGNLLGFPNSIIGVALFPAPVLVGIGSLAGARFPRWYWRVFSAFVAAAWLLCLWFQWYSVWGRHLLCPVCEVTWMAVIPMFWYTLGWTLKEGVWGRAAVRAGRWIFSWGWVLAVADVLVVVLVTQIFLNWMGI